MSAPALRDIHTLFYRGYLKSCNYHCGYCPFHKHARNDKKRDEAALWRMVDHFASFRYAVECDDYALWRGATLALLHGGAGRN